MVISWIKDRQTNYSEAGTLTLLPANPSPDYLQGDLENPKKEPSENFRQRFICVNSSKERQTERQTDKGENNQSIHGASLLQSRKLFLERLFVAVLDPALKPSTDLGGNGATACELAELVAPSPCECARTALG